MIVKRVYKREGSNKYENVKITARQKVNQTIFYKLHSILEFADEIVPEWELMTDKEREKVYNMLKKELRRYINY